ncbi:MAG: hypothetical protein LBG06_05860 [Deltaproteobacteria bacterium]|jgi:hypothetical protein|nr:hypothetical protein [Deltaproteobacteria bacterium]
MRAPVLSLAALLAGGCAAAREPCPALPLPPTVYLQDVQAPVFRGATNADPAAHVLDLREALKRSNLDKAALREWLAGQGD